VVTLAIPASAQAITTVERIPFETSVLLCNGGVVELEGRLLVTTTSTATPAGGFVFAIHFQPQGVKGIDITTGTIYIATGLTRDLVVARPPGGLTETYVNRFHIQATTGAESYIVTELARRRQHVRLVAQLDAHAADLVRGEAGFNGGQEAEDRGL
jgi:hypothetical protein